MRRTNSTLKPESTAQVKLKVDNISSNVDAHEQTVGSKLQCTNKMHCERTTYENTQQKSVKNWFKHL